MAKHPLFGNHKEPRCETCAHGHLSPDKQSVLCRYSGSAPLDHHCRRYTYDPLRRIPRRAAQPEAIEAQAFSLDDAPSFSPEEGDTYHRRLMGELRTYLDETKDPNVDTILTILQTRSIDDTAELLRDATSVDADAKHHSTALLFSADDSDDIFDDLDRLIEMTFVTTDDVDGSEIEPMPPLDNDSLLFDISTPEEDDDPLSVDDLLLLADETTQEDPSYTTPPLIPNDALSIAYDGDVEDEYTTPLPIPDSALPILNDKEHDTYDD